MRVRSRNQRGSSILEFTMVGIAMIFVLISFFEMARGMWIYHTLAYAVREGVRYSSVHGQGCASPHTCQVNLGQIATVIKNAGPGIDQDQTTLIFTSATGAQSTGTIKNLLSNTTTWPPSGANAPGQNVKISLSYPFRTVLAIFWVGDGHALNDSQTFNLAASSTEAVQF